VLSYGVATVTTTSLTRFVLLSSVLLFASSARAGTVWDGAYTEAQAARGQAIYQRKCELCHGDDGLAMAAQGLPLMGPEFVDLWREDNLDVLVSFIRAKMPKGVGGEIPVPGTGPLTLDEAGKLDVIAYILMSSGFPAGPSELTLASASTTLLVGKDGRKPLPDLTNVIVTGCLTDGPNNSWTLTKPTSPKRTMTPLQINPEDKKVMTPSTSVAPSLRVNSLDSVTSFNATTAKGDLVVVKGVLYISTDNFRVNAMAAESLGVSCTQ
jgi:mono/diheme cytochrome c family protein